MPKLKTLGVGTTPEMNFINQLHIAICTSNWMNWDISHDGDGHSNGLVLTFKPTGQSIYIPSTSVGTEDEDA